MSLGSLSRPIWPDIFCKFHPLRGLYNHGRSIFNYIFKAAFLVTSWQGDMATCEQRKSKSKCIFHILKTVFLNFFAFLHFCISGDKLTRGMATCEQRASDSNMTRHVPHPPFLLRLWLPKPKAPKAWLLLGPQWTISSLPLVAKTKSTSAWLLLGLSIEKSCKTRVAEFLPKLKVPQLLLDTWLIDPQYFFSDWSFSIYFQTWFTIIKTNSCEE